MVGGGSGGVVFKKKKKIRTPRGDKSSGPAGDISDEIYELTFANIFSHVNNEIVVVQRSRCGSGNL